MLRHEIAHCNGWPADHLASDRIQAQVQTKKRSHHSSHSLLESGRGYKTSPPMVIRMSTIPLTTEGRIFVARMIRDVRDRERMSFGTVQANCYPRRRPPAPIVMKMELPHRHGQRRDHAAHSRGPPIPTASVSSARAIWRMGG